MQIVENNSKALYFENGCYNKCLMLQQKSCLRNVEFPGGRGVIKDPLEWKFLRGGGGGCKPKPSMGGGMNIFLNRTMLVVTRAGGL